MPHAGWLSVLKPAEGASAATTVHLVESSSRPGGVQLVNARKVNKTSDPMDLVELARQIQTADKFTRAHCTSKLSIIADQMKFLQEQARKVLEEAKRDHDLHHAACNMVKTTGSIYYLYLRDSGQQYFSLLSPQEWSDCPHQFLGAYKLEHDMTWTPVEEMDARNQKMAMIDNVLNMQLVQPALTHTETTENQD